MVPRLKQIQYLIEQSGIAKELGKSLVEVRNMTMEELIGWSAYFQILNEEQEKEFEKYAGLFDLSRSDYRRSFLSDGDIYFLVALKPRNRKYPVIGENQNGTRYKFPRNVLATLS